MADDLFAYPGRPRSSAWRYFGFRKSKPGPPIKENLDMSQVICRLCLKAYANKGNTTNLQFHLDKHHRHEASSCTSTPPSPSSSSSGKSSVPTHSKQPKIDMQLTRAGGKISAEKRLRLDDQLQRLVVAKCLPLSLVKSPYFNNFVKELDPRYEIPSKYMVKKKLERKQVHMQQKLHRDLPSTEGHIALTKDSWTSSATQSYETVTAHYITSDWEVRSAVLQTARVEGSHTSEKIATHLRETVSKWGLPQQPTVVTDNAANERKAIEQLLGWPRFGCYGHRLNLAVKHALEVYEVSKILGKARKTVTLFHQSTSLNDCLFEKQRVLYSATPNQIGLKLVAD